MGEKINQAGLEEVSKVDDKLQQLSNEIDRLAEFILFNYPEEPGKNGKSESAVDVAIRLLEKQDKRDELIKRNQEFVQIPMPDFSKMTDEELEKRANVMEQAFHDAFNEPDDEDDDDDL